MTSPVPLPDLPPDTQLRSGTAARLAGLPATTLRVWERRYGVVAAPRTPGGQRLYAASDVRRLVLLRRLTRQGHGIGTIAKLPLEALQALAATAARTERAAAAPEAGQVVVIGPAIAARLRSCSEADGWVAFEDLDRALAAGRPTPPHGQDGPCHVVAEAPSLSAPVVEGLQTLARTWHASVTVVYRFGPAAAVQALQDAGVQAWREPVPAVALERWLEAAARPAVAPRRFSDADLAHLAGLPSTVLCECPRHLAEIVAQLAAFEHYSADCGDADPPAAAMHRRLHALAADARARFEQALADLADAEGLTLPGR